MPTPDPTPRWTGGSWHAAGALDSPDDYEIISDDGTIIARVVGGRTTPGDEDGEDGQSEANAIVISLVPELLDIMRMLADGYTLSARGRAVALFHELADHEGDRWAIR